jgi:flavin reductase (DIM6/NTAB) family NADH-FMN oxidoreductase RutF
MTSGSRVSANGSAGGIDGRRFREVLGSYPTGVTVITAIDEEGNPAGMAVGTFTSVSLDPPLVAFLPDKSSTSFPRIRTAASFCVNVLGAHQEDVCRAFATRGGDKFSGVAWSPAGSGAPRIDGVAAGVDCDFESVTEAGDHWFVLGRVRDLDANAEHLPLVFFQGGYGRFSPSSLVALPEADFVSHLRLADVARPVLERVAGEVGTESLVIAPVDDQLVVLASAGAPAAGAEFTRVGQRMPFVPPIGTPFLAWAEPDTVRGFLSRAGRELGESEHDDYLRQLARVRERGWSLSLGHELHAELDAAIESYSGGDRDSRGRVARLGAQLVHRFEPAEDLDPATGYDIRLVSVPAFGPDGAVALTLTLWDPPRPTTGAEAAGHIRVLREAAAEVTRALGGRAPA